MGTVVDVWVVAVAAIVVGVENSHVDTFVLAVVVVASVVVVVVVVEVVTKIATCDVVTGPTLIPAKISLE